MFAREYNSSSKQQCTWCVIHKARQVSFEAFRSGTHEIYKHQNDTRARRTILVMHRNTCDIYTGTCVTPGARTNFAIYSHTSYGMYIAVGAAGEGSERTSSHHIILYNMIHEYTAAARVVLQYVRHLSLSGISRPGQLEWRVRRTAWRWSARGGASASKFRDPAICLTCTWYPTAAAAAAAVSQFLLNPFRTAVPFWGQTTQISGSLSPKRDCGPKRGKQ